MAFDDYSKSNVKSLYQRWYGKRTVKSSPSFTPIETISGGVYTKAITDGINGKKNPLYKTQLRNVLSATTPCSGNKTSLVVNRQPSCTLNFTYNRGGYPPGFEYNAENYTYGFVPNVLSELEQYLVDTDALTRAENLSIQKLYDDLDKMVSAVKSGEDVGEIHQTRDALKSLLKPARDLLNMAWHLRKSAFNLRQAKQVAVAAADTWLQFSFGWKPLSKTVHDAVIGLADRNVYYNYQPFHATQKVSVADTKKFLQCAIPTANIAIDSITKRTTTYQVTYQGIWAEETQLPEREIASVLGLQARDVLPTIWNLIPFSFLADYFINIGEIARAIAVPWGGVRWCNKTVRTSFDNAGLQHYNQNITASDLLKTTYDVWHPVDGLINHTRTTFVRSDQSTLPLPTLRLNNPLDLSWRRWANMAALCVTMAQGQTKTAQRVVAQHPELPHLFSREMAYRGFRALKNQ